MAFSRASLALWTLLQTLRWLTLEDLNERWCSGEFVSSLFTTCRVSADPYLAIVQVGAGGGRVRMGPNGFEWVRMGVKGSEWVRMGSNGSE